MRFLGTGKYQSLGGMYLRLQSAGHEVRVQAPEGESRTVLNNMVEHVADWRAQLGWLREAGDDGIILVESTDMGEEQDALRRQGFQVIGGSAFGDRLENDRAFGQGAMRAAGMKTAPTQEFHDFSSAEDYVRRHRKRYVFKLSGTNHASSLTYVGELEDGSDVLALLDFHRRHWPAEESAPHFVLMDHVAGVEVGVGAYFNGQRFMDPVVIDFEHKRFFDGDLGENTGEMGTLLSYEHSRPLFEHTLAKMAEPLRDGFYVGYINLNTIVNENGIWPIEFTARFGYPGFAICEALHAEGWDMLFARMLKRKETHFRTHPGFAIGVALTVPPFPYLESYEQLSKGMPVFFREPLTDEDRRNLHYEEVELRDGQIVTSGESGYVAVVTGRGVNVEDARAKAYRLARKIVVPNLRYRTDIGVRFARESALLSRWGLWPE